MNKVTKTFLVEIEVSGDETHLLHDIKSWARIESDRTHINSTSINKITVAPVQMRDSLCDKNDRLIKLYSDVEMPSPDIFKNDNWKYGNFIAMVIKFKGDNIVVQDQDGNAFEIEACRVEIVEG